MSELEISHVHAVSWFVRDPGGGTICVKPKETAAADEPEPEGTP